MTTVTIAEIESNRCKYVFCTIPKWAKYAVVTARGEVVRWLRK